MIISRQYVLAAGGTGGHMIPAYALGRELLDRGHNVALVTDGRGAKIPGKPEDMDLHILPAGRIGGIRGTLAGIRAIWRGRSMASQLYDSYKPTVVVGFGGYPAMPSLLAAYKHNIPTIIHEQNAVLGRVNRLSAHKVAAIATAYPNVKRLNSKYSDKTHLVGNPVREEILQIRDKQYPVITEQGLLRILVTGGSQGANILSNIVPDAMTMLPVNLRSRLQVIQQCREEDIEAVRAIYSENEIPAELATYMPDLPEKLSLAHLVIARAGASTIAELTAAGRPAILIPLPSAMDDHQSHNVSEIVKAGGARVIKQADILSQNFDNAGDSSNINNKRILQSKAKDKMRDLMVKQIQKMALKPETLKNAAAKAKSCGRPDAASDLADLVESFGAAPNKPKKHKFKGIANIFGSSPAYAKDIK